MANDCLGLIATKDFMKSSLSRETRPTKLMPDCVEDQARNETHSTWSFEIES